MQNSRVLDKIKILVFAKDHVPSNDACCKTGCGDDLLREIDAYTRVKNGGKIAVKTVRRTVLHPVIVRVDRTAEFSASFSIGVSLFL
mmetsp:Transcript_11400/g.17287  ORF Transcript_11400/g.17287 Transcript_11400/m.17287 type:complete len:87 (-) Transcript_11400:338-598(-)